MVVFGVGFLTVILQLRSKFPLQIFTEHTLDAIF